MMPMQQEVLSLECGDAFGEEWNGDSHEPIGTQFQEHSGENDGTHRWRLGVRIGQPVKWGTVL